MPVTQPPREPSPMYERLTLVVITHNREASLRRTLQHYKQYPCRILVLDSSAVAANLDVDFPGVDYRHLPQFSYSGLQEKLAYGISQVSTPLMSFAADDDFIVHEALDQSVEFLEANPDYSLCHGYSLMFLAQGDSVLYYRRNKKVQEDYCSADAAQRATEFLGQFIPPFYAVTRTALLQQWYAQLPAGTNLEWQEIGHAYFLILSGKARILPIPYVVREANYGRSDHNTDVINVLYRTDPANLEARERFAAFMASLPTTLAGDAEQRKSVALQAFATMADGLLKRRALAMDRIFLSRWADPFCGPIRQFKPDQYVEMPFYNQPFFDLLAQFEFLLHAMPAGRLQREQLEGIWQKQFDLARRFDNDTPQTYGSRLWEAATLNIFNRDVLQALAAHVQEYGDAEEAAKLREWIARLRSVPAPSAAELYRETLSARIGTWLNQRAPTAGELKQLQPTLSAPAGLPRIGILLLDLEADTKALQATFDSLMAGQYKAFKVVVLSAGEPPAITSPDNTVHFVQITPDNLVLKLNQAARLMGCDWLTLARVGEEFTAAGLLKAALDLREGGELHAVLADEVHRRPDGSLRDVLRPGFDLDMLLGAPSLMARHWLVRSDILLQLGGYRADCSQALELDLSLRLIETFGTAAIAHLAEPLLICDAAPDGENPDERKTLLRHLGVRGYQAAVNPRKAGLWSIDYRHASRAKVSIIMEANAAASLIHDSLASVIQLTRYQHFEVLVAVGPGSPIEYREWLASLERPGGRVRVVEVSGELTRGAVINRVSQAATGEYLVLFDTRSRVVDPNWLDSLLNQAQRSEVAITGPKLLDERGNVAQAGLVLGLNGSIASPLVGAKADDLGGFMQRLVVEQARSAVSDACLMVRKTLFEQLGGMDEEANLESFIDVDLCLQAGQAGYLVVWAPEAKVQSADDSSRASQGFAALCQKWQSDLQRDSHYSSHHLYSGAGYVLDESSRPDWI